jgi:hypothetical protein
MCSTRIASNKNARILRGEGGGGLWFTFHGLWTSFWRLKTPYGIPYELLSRRCVISGCGPPADFLLGIAVPNRTSHSSYIWLHTFYVFIPLLSRTAPLVKVQERSRAQKFCYAVSLTSCNWTHTSERTLASSKGQQAFCSIALLAMSAYIFLQGFYSLVQHHFEFTCRSHSKFNNLQTNTLRRDESFVRILDFPKLSRAG